MITIYYNILNSVNSGSCGLPFLKRVVCFLIFGRMFGKGSRKCLPRSCVTDDSLRLSKGKTSDYRVNLHVGEVLRD